MKIDFGVITVAVYYAAALLAGSYFAVAAIQGDSGRLARITLLNEANILESQLESLRAEVSRMENKVRRLSGDYLDLELLDERARVVLGLASENEIIIH